VEHRIPAIRIFRFILHGGLNVRMKYTLFFYI